MSYGVFPLYHNFPVGPFTVPNPVIEWLTQEKYLNKGDHVLVIHGEHWRNPGLTNALAVIQI